MNKNCIFEFKLNRFVGIGLFLGMFFFAVGPVFASATVGLPYEDYLKQVSDSLSGPVAFALALIALVVAGGMLIFGGDFSTFTRSLLYVIMVCSILLGARKIVTAFFGATEGAVITGCAPKSRVDHQIAEPALLVSTSKS